MQTDRFSRRSVLRTAGSLGMILEPAFAFQTAGPVRHEEARARRSPRIPKKYAIRLGINHKHRDKFQDFGETLLHGLRAQKNAKAL